MKMFLSLKHCNVHLSHHILRATRCQSLLSTFPTGNNVLFLYGPRLRSKSLDFRHVPQPRSTRVFQNPRHTVTMKQVCDGRTSGSLFGKKHEACCRGVEISPATHLPAKTSYRILVRARGLVTSYQGSNFVLEHIATHAQMICRFCQEAIRIKFPVVHLWSAGKAVAMSSAISSRRF